MRFGRQDGRKGAPISSGNTHSSTEGNGWRDLVPAALLLLLTVVAIFAVTMSADARSREVAVIAPIWADEAEVAEIVAQSGGNIVATAGFSNIIIAQSDAPDFVSALYESGAWWVLDAVKLRACLPA
jgi:hypothetical protein